MVNSARTFSAEEVKVVRKLARGGNSIADIAVKLDLDPQVISRSKHLMKVFNKGRVDLKISLRKAQIDLKKHVPMAVHLGKVYLDQKDEHEIVVNPLTRLTPAEQRERLTEQLRLLDEAEDAGTAIVED